MSKPNTLQRLVAAYRWLTDHPVVKGVSFVGAVMLVVGIVAALVHDVGHVLRHVSALTIISDALIAVGVVVLAVVAMTIVVVLRYRIDPASVPKSSDPTPATPDLRTAAIL